MTDEELFFDRRGVQISLERWADLWKNKAYRFLKKSITPKKRYGVITIWNGHDLSFTFGPKRLIFSTAVIRLTDKHRKKLEKYPIEVELFAESEKEALEDHEQLLREWGEKE